MKKIPKEVIDVFIETAIEILKTLKTMNNKKPATKIKSKTKKTNVKNSVTKSSQ